jgi:hypothetical protein
MTKQLTVKISDLPFPTDINDGTILPIVSSGVTSKTTAADMRNYVLNGIVQGFQGEQGIQGDVGPQGSQGDGFQGFQGFQGLQGGRGYQGPIGHQGRQGSGYQGEVGEQGLMGIIGYQGLTGPQGCHGSQGYQGFQGSLTANLVYTEGSNILSSSNIDNYAIGNGTFFKITGTISSSIGGFTGGVSGRVIIIFNNTNENQTFLEESIDSNPSNRFVLGVSNKTININQTASFIYVTGLTIGGNSGQSRWILTSNT